MSNAHEMVIYYVCKIVCGKSVRFDQNIVVKAVIRSCDRTEDRIFKCGFAFTGDFLPDYIRYSGGKLFIDLFLRKAGSATVIFSVSSV